MTYEVQVEFHKDFIKVDGKIIIVGLTSKPQKGKTNMELIKKLAKYFNVSSSKVKIVSGFKSRRKIIEIVNEE
jgi:uncharacterized protein (TIGR00251 family)